MEDNKNEIGKFIDPDAIIAQLDIQVGSVAADFGCGPGYFSIPFAKAIGEDGKIYVLDVLPQVLETVIGKAKNSGLTNVIAKRVNLEKENGSKRIQYYGKCRVTICWNCRRDYKHMLRI